MYLFYFFITLWSVLFIYSILKRGKQFAIGAGMLFFIVLLISVLIHLPLVLAAVLLLIVAYFRLYAIGFLYKYFEFTVFMLSAKPEPAKGVEALPVQYVSTETAAQLSGKSIATIRLKLSQYSEEFKTVTGMSAVEYAGNKGERFINIQFINKYIK